MAAMQYGEVWSLYFIFMIVLTNFALVNLMIGVIVERIIRLSVEQETELSAFVAESEQFRTTLRTLFESADLDHSGDLSRQELKTLLTDSRTQEIMSAFGINLNIPAATLHTIMGLDVDGEIKFDDFLDACMRLCGSKQSIHSMFVQSDICETQHVLCARLSKIERNVKELSKKMSERQLPQQTQVKYVSSAPPVQQMPPARPAELDRKVEAAIQDLHRRMDKFEKAQSQILLEIRALKEKAAMRPLRLPLPNPAQEAIPNGELNGMGGGSELAADMSMGTPSGSVKRTKKPTPRTPRTPAYSVAETLALRDRYRQELQAEFLEKKMSAR
eukprot:gnl/TRDRNA2_/TRDRNA2_95102_c1_seq1.p1 gnl/TRDRNA2_/TRDRNA2_95102_c1~~gnl/TRDRNA2_/TRDRNA2_95102_c1_seq1.p1  ORF type:complete len:350 (+),score=81.33 gnl/TRDRNA2_/TRDRNA2_95102_c1_seq1:63-1052(+)